MRGGLITPLQKRTREGKLYTRDDGIEARLLELEQLTRNELVTKCEIRGRKDPDYVPSECLLYFLRSSRNDNSDDYFERLYKLLVERVLRRLRRLPCAESSDGKSLSLTRAQIGEKAFDRFVALLAADRQAYSEKLDYFEIRFDGAVASLRRDAQEQAWREENRSTTLDYDDESGELSPEVERAVGHFDTFDTSDFDVADYRSRLDAAIEALPPEQSRIVEMIRLGSPSNPRIWPR